MNKFINVTHAGCKMCHGEGNVSRARVVLHKRGSGLNYRKKKTWRFPARSHNYLKNFLQASAFWWHVRRDHKIHQQSIFHTGCISHLYNSHEKMCIAMTMEHNSSTFFFINVIVIQNYPHTIPFLSKMRRQITNTLLFFPVNVVCICFRVYTKNK